MRSKLGSRRRERRSAADRPHPDDEDTVTATIEIQPEDDLIPLDEVKRLAGIGKTMIYRLERAKQIGRASCRERV